MVTRLEAMEGKIPECESFRVDLGALLSELAVLNSNMKALTEAMISNLKQTEDVTRFQSKVDGDKTLASSTPDANTCKTFPSGSLRPSTKHNGSHKGNTCQGSGPQVLERTRSNTRMQYGTQRKEILRPLSPPSLDMTVQAPLPIAVRLSSADEDATTVDERANGSLSPSSDCTFPSPMNKAIIGAPKTKKRTSNVRGKIIANRTILDIENDYSKEPEVKSLILTSKKVSTYCIFLLL